METDGDIMIPSPEKRTKGKNDKGVKSAKMGPGKKFKGNRRGGAPSGGVIYLGHIPHGFYEEEMKKFFAQFGDVEKVKLARSRKTGKSRGYAFIKFRYAEVAGVVAETMNNFLLRDKLMKCEVVPKEKIYPRMFNSSLEWWRKRKLAIMNRHDEAKLGIDVEVKRMRTYNKLMAKKEELAKLGIDLKELDVLDTTEKEYIELPKIENEGTKKTKPRPKEVEEEEEEEAIRFALRTVPEYKKLMEDLEKAKKGEDVEWDEDDEEDSGSDVFEDDEDSDFDSDEADKTVDSVASGYSTISAVSAYRGNEVRVFDSDSEIEMKTPPGMKKRKVVIKKKKGKKIEVDEGISEESHDEVEKAKEKTPLKKTPSRNRYFDSEGKKGKSTPSSDSKLKIFPHGSKAKSEKRSRKSVEVKQKRRKSEPIGTSLLDKKFKNTAFLDRSLKRKRISKRADEMDSD